MMTIDRRSWEALDQSKKTKEVKGTNQGWQSQMPQRPAVITGTAWLKCGLRLPLQADKKDPAGYPKAH